MFLKSADGSIFWHGFRSNLYAG